MTSHGGRRHVNLFEATNSKHGLLRPPPAFPPLCLLTVFTSLIYFAHTNFSQWSSSSSVRLSRYANLNCFISTEVHTRAWNSSVPPGFLIDSALKFRLPTEGSPAFSTPTWDYSVPSSTVTETFVKSAAACRSLLAIHNSLQLQLSLRRWSSRNPSSISPFPALFTRQHPQGTSIFQLITKGAPTHPTFLSSQLFLSPVFNLFAWIASPSSTDPVITFLLWVTVLPFSSFSTTSHDHQTPDTTLPCYKTSRDSAHTFISTTVIHFFWVLCNLCNFLLGTM